MPAVKHMKWWGWGVEGVSFHWEDKPAFPAFVKRAMGIDVASPPAAPMSIEQLGVPAPRVSDEVRGRLTDAVGAANVAYDDLERVVHTYGKSLRDLLRLRAADLPRAPDVVVYPGSEDDVRAVLDLALEADLVIIPFGGGSNIAGSLHPEPDEERTVVSLDLGRMNQVLDLDEDSGLARVQAGVLGPDLEEQLGRRGWTMGHYPDSFTHSTLGGWVATRSSGMQSDKYGDIAKISRGMRVVQPGGTLVVRPLPSTSTGPNTREMVLGSEGRLGIITEVTVQVHRIPENRLITAYLFPSWEAGLAAMQEISTSDAHPSVTRVSDSFETQFSLSTRKASKGFSVSSAVGNGLFKLLERRGWDLDQACLSFIGFEGGRAHVAHEKGIVNGIVKAHGGIGLGKGPAVLYDQKKFDTPYIRDFVLDRGGAADVSETAAPWSKLLPLYTAVMENVRKVYADLGVTGWVMCHLSHSEHSGACLYFTFAFSHDGVDPIGQYDRVKVAVQETFIEQGGTLSHHHAVGTEHSRWLAEDISEQGVVMVQGVIDTVDAGRHLNPGKITQR
ncbi:FAD-binding oxidoreductase [Microlunatus flavus]|uniref:Alkyldihydroxyacetonephosphate synthase n=1 Tax=Microlunatus flavus TaxID=1036181 RepID=A0A1H9AIK2_9ACTN|nr:FAD-binding oxidoreductase [Microlunatus flavus]SEP76550.1 alkyldihydroxyacetonephosphate synthase [Microlunatus flavus]